MNSKYLKYFSVGVYCILAFPFILAGFFWREIKTCFEEGKRLAIWTGEKYDRWLNGNS